MPENFVTLFDSYFLPQGISLIQSLLSFDNYDFKLWIICCDEKSFIFLEKLNFPRVILLKLDELESSNLKLLRSKRSLREYYWTITPLSFLWVYSKDNSIERLTYLDADLYFFKSPSLIIDEFKKSKKDFFITKHSYLPELDQSNSSGIYCVQFISSSFPNGLDLLHTWSDQCIDSCFDMVKDGKYGDQKYLEDLVCLYPTKIHILEKEFYAQAPWNAGKFVCGDAVFFHFQGLRIKKNFQVDFGYFKIPKFVFLNIYRPYLNNLYNSILILQNIGWELKSQGKIPNLLRRFLRRIRILKNNFDNHIFYRDNYKLNKD